MARDPEPKNFLSLDSWEKSVSEIESSEAVISLKLQISDNKYIFERNVYTFFTLIGDVGGFNGAIIILPTFVMAIYSKRMYKGSI